MEDDGASLRSLEGAHVTEFPANEGYQLVIFVKLLVCGGQYFPSWPRYLSRLEPSALSISVCPDKLGMWHSPEEHAAAWSSSDLRL